MIKDFPHYSDAAMRAALKMLGHHFGYRGEAMWWRLLERLNQNDTKPIDFSDHQTAVLSSEYIHPYQRDPEARMKEVVEFLDYCAGYKDKQGVCLIDAELWKTKQVWSSRNAENQSRVLKRRKPKADIPTEVVEFARQMLLDVRKHTPYAKGAASWPASLYDIVKHDHPTLDTVKKVWNWLQNSNDRDALFWRKNVKSPRKLEKQFAQLESLCRGTKPKSTNIFSI